MNFVDRSQREQSLADAARRVDGCRRCEIGSSRRHSVYGEGDPNARLMIVGEGPGQTEDASGRPFIGRAGQLLEKMLGAIALARQDVYICNTVKCRPTMPGVRGLCNRAPLPDEMTNCRPYLDEQIAIIRPMVLLALGAPAAKSFLGKGFLIGKQRGTWFSGPLGIPLMVTFHPAYLLRQTGGNFEAVKALVWGDLQAVRSKLDPLAFGQGGA